MPLPTRLVLASLLAVVASCAGPARAAKRDTVDADNVTQCRSLCESAGGRLQSIVIVANRTGCVCGIDDGASVDGSTAATAGGAVVAVLEEEEQQRQQQQDQLRRQGQP